MADALQFPWRLAGVKQRCDDMRISRAAPHAVGRRANRAAGFGRYGGVSDVEAALRTNEP